MLPNNVMHAIASALYGQGFKAADVEKVLQAINTATRNELLISIGLTTVSLATATAGLPPMLGVYESILARDWNKNPGVWLEILEAITLEAIRSKLYVPTKLPAGTDRENSPGPGLGVDAGPGGGR